MNSYYNCPYCFGTVWVGDKSCNTCNRKVQTADISASNNTYQRPNQEGEREDGS